MRKDAKGKQRYRELLNSCRQSSYNYYLRTVNLGFAPSSIGDKRYRFVGRIKADVVYPSPQMLRTDGADSSSSGGNDGDVPGMSPSRFTPASVAALKEMMAPMMTPEMLSSSLSSSSIQAETDRGENEEMERLNLVESVRESLQGGRAAVANMVRRGRNFAGVTVNEVGRRVGAAAAIGLSKLSSSGNGGRSRLPVSQYKIAAPPLR
jgi:hypothetical protein